MFAALPFVELYLLVLIGRELGFWATLAMMVAAGLGGAVLAKAQGRRVLREWQTALSEGRVPQEGIVSGLLVLVGAVLLITPGVLSDVIGLFFLLPPTRKLLAFWLRAVLTRRIARGQLRVMTFSQSADGPRGPAPRRDGQQPAGAPFVRPTGPIIDA